MKGHKGRNGLCSIKRRLSDFWVRILCCMVRPFLRAISGTRDLIPIFTLFFLFFFVSG